MYENIQTTYLLPHTQGVHSVMVALLSEKADVQYYPEEMDPEQLLKEVKSLGFGGVIVPDQDGLQEGKLDIIVRLETLFFLRVYMMFQSKFKTLKILLAVS